jgi:hypothetical protein
MFELKAATLTKASPRMTTTLAATVRAMRRMGQAYLAVHADTLVR